MPSLIVIDNFYPNPDSIVKKIESMEFVEPEDVEGWRTTSGYFPRNMENLLRQKSGLIISELDKPQGTPHDNGTFYHSLSAGNKKEKPAVHWDLPLNHHVCIVYLSKNIAANCGTSFYRHKSLGLECAPTQRDARKLGKTKEALIEKINLDCRNKKNFEEIDRVAYRFNRAVIFPAKRLHAATAHQGSDLKNGRIYQIFSFKAKQPKV